MTRSGKSLPTTIGHSVRLLNEITSRDDPGRPAFLVSGGRRATPAPISFVARAQEEERGREGFEPRRFRRAPGGSAHSRSPRDILP
jgi:hypothetical protein